jgi:hypothetical protein
MKSRSAGSHSASGSLHTAARSARAYANELERHLLAAAAA